MILDFLVFFGCYGDLLIFYCICQKVVLLYILFTFRNYLVLFGDRWFVGYYIYFIRLLILETIRIIVFVFKQKMSLVLVGLFFLLKCWELKVGFVLKCLFVLY